MVGASHQIFEFVEFLLEFDFADFLLIDDIIAADGDQIELLDLILKHVFQFLDVGFIEFVALHSFFLKQLYLQLKRVVHLGQLAGFNGLTLLELDSICLESLNFIASLTEFTCQVIVILDEAAVFLDECIIFEL